MTMNLEIIRAMGHTRRWHTAPVLREQNLAEHSALVALLGMWLVRDLAITAEEKADILHLALLHDAHETVYGDLPYRVKRETQSRGIDLDGECQLAFWGWELLERFQTFAVKIVHMADRLEAALHAERWVPELADETMNEAIRVAETTFADGSEISNKILTRVRTALGVI
jgi:5'-deoxynucleotidase YfbR-like HD superfamily hydrolase